MGKHEAPGENWFALIIWTKCFHSASEMPPSASAALILVRQAGFPSCSTPSSMLAVSWQCRKAKIWTSKKNLMVSHLGFVVQQEIATSATAALPQSYRLMFAEWPRQCLHPDIKGEGHCGKVWVHPWWGLQTTGRQESQQQHLGPAQNIYLSKSSSLTWKMS